MSSSAGSQGRLFPRGSRRPRPCAPSDPQDFATRLPQLGMPLPSMPAVPSAGGPPFTADVPGISSYMPSAAGMGGVPLPPQVPVLPQDPRSAPAVVSPFSLPMPEFGATFPAFEAGVPALPPLAPLRSEDDAKSALTTASPFYFLENAGGMSTPVAAPATASQAATPSVGLLQVDPRSAAVSPFSLPMPEFGAALFPSFEAGVPKLPALPPLRNESDARAALTDSSSFYFLDGMTAAESARLLIPARRILGPWAT